MKRLMILPALLAALAMQAQNSFDEVVDLIVGSNTELQSRLRLIEADRLDASDANSLANPSVEVGRVWGAKGVGNKLQVDVKQDFEWPGVYGARSKAAETSKKVSELQYSLARKDMEGEVRRLMLELIYTRRQIALVENLSENFDQIRASVDKGVAGGELTVIDQRKMMIEAFEIADKLTSLTTRENDIVTELKSMSGKSIDLSSITEYPLIPLLGREKYREAIDKNPGLLESVLEAESRSSEARVATMSRYPGFSVGYQHQAEMGDRFNGFTVGMTLPVFAGRHARHAANLRKEAADLTAEQKKESLEAELEGLLSDLQIQRGRIVAYNMAFGDNRYPELLQKAYEGGQMSVIEYLSEIHYYHQTMLIYLEAEYSYNNTLNTLNSLYNY